MDAAELQTVRARLGVYFDKTGNVRNQCVFAAMCVALTDAHQGRLSRIDVEALDDEITITDDGPGLSMSARPGEAPVAQEMMSVLGACSVHKPHPQFGEMLCDISLAAVNAISSTANIVTMVDGIAYAQRYTLGTPTAPFKPVARESTGTRLRFTLDKRWAGRKDFDLVAVENQVHRLGLNLSKVSMSFSAA